MVKSIDITSLCTLFPSPVPSEMPREALVYNLEQIFLKERIVFVQGKESTGKTTLLSQFAKAYRNKSFSYFFTQGQWTHDRNTYFLDMCEQMGSYIRAQNKGDLPDVDYDKLSEYELKDQYYRLIRKIVKAAKAGQGPFYFVIDGINYLPEVDGEESALSHLPYTDISGIGLLLSGTPETKAPTCVQEKIYQYFIPPFSRLEAEKYLGDFLIGEQVNEVFSSCDGMIGYLAEIRRQLENGVSVDNIMCNLQPGYYSLLERHWNKLNISEQEELIIALLIFSPEKLSCSNLAAILEKDETIIRSEIRQLNCLRESPSGSMEFEPGYKAFATEKVKTRRAQALQLLIGYNEKLGQYINLPDLYRASNSYDQLFSLVQPDSLAHLLVEEKKVSFVRRSLRFVSEMAYEKEDWFRLAWGGLAEAIFTKLVTSPIMIEEQVKALLALERSDEAIEFAQSCVLPEDRLKIFSVICRYLQEKSREIPKNVIANLEDSVNLFDSTVELSNEIQEKVIDVCADMFPIRPDLSLALLEKIARDKGLDDYDGKLIDLLMTQLILRLGPDGETSQDVLSQIKDDNLRNFVLAGPAAITGVAAKDVLQQVAGLKDNSAKLFLLQAWCNKNSHNDEAHLVVECALNLIVTSEKYSPTQSHLRQFSEPLKYCTDIEAVKKLVAFIDLLKGAGLKSPLDESAWLELQLAIIEKRWCQKTANQRLNVVLSILTEDVDLDTKCMILARILLLLPDVSSNFEAESASLKSQLIADYLRLMESSAEQLKMSKKLIAIVCRHDHLLAREFAQLLNTEDGRFIALAEVLRVYTRKDPGSLDFKFITDILDEIAHTPYRDWVLVQVIRRFASHEKSSLQEKKKLYFCERILGIESSAGKTIGCAYYLTWVKGGTASLLGRITSVIKTSLDNIDPLWVKVGIGFDVVNIVSAVDKDLATDIFNEIVQLMKENMFCEPRISSLYIESCKTAIRLVPDLVKSKEGEERIQSILDAISIIPSVLDKCKLLGELGLKCEDKVPVELLNRIMQRGQTTLAESSDIDSKNRAFVVMAPLFFNQNTTAFMDYIESTSEAVRDEALRSVVNYIFGRKLPGEELDEKCLGKISYYEAKKICDNVLPYVSVDNTIFCIVENLINMMVEMDGHGQEKLHFTTESQSLVIVKALMDTANNKLPDKKNISHNGYLLACKVAFARLRDAAVVSKCRNRSEWDKLCPRWEDLIPEIEKMENTADRVFVLALAGKNAYKNNKKMGEAILKRTKDHLALIDNKVDRAFRYEIVAESYNACSDKQAAAFLVEEAMKCAECCSIAEGRDQLMSRIVEFAHSVDVTLAATIASRVDEPGRRAYLEDNLKILALHADPAFIERYKKNECQRFLEPSFRKILRTLSSDFATTQQDKVIGEWIHKTLGRDYELINLAVFWFLENKIKVNRQAKSAQLNEFSLYQASLLKLINLVGNAVSRSSTQANSLSGELLSDMKFFKRGQQEEAKNAIIEWLNDHVKSYLYIYDPYLDENDLWILKSVHQQTQVTILKAAYLHEWEGMDKRFGNAWRQICHQSPPETNVYVFMNKDRKTPLHDRFLITDNCGLTLGTSLNGLGNKDTTVSILDIEEKTKIQDQFIDPLILRAPKEYEGVSLSKRVFSLV